MDTLPAWGRTNPMSMRMVTDLPAPFAPRNPTASPWLTANVRSKTPRSAPVVFCCPFNLDDRHRELLSDGRWFHARPLTQKEKALYVGSVAGCWHARMVRAGGQNPPWCGQVFSLATRCGQSTAWCGRTSSRCACTVPGFVHFGRRCARTTAGSVQRAPVHAPPGASVPADFANPHLNRQNPAHPATIAILYLLALSRKEPHVDLVRPDILASHLCRSSRTPTRARPP